MKKRKKKWRRGGKYLFELLEKDAIRQWFKKQRKKIRTPPILNKDIFTK